MTEVSRTGQMVCIFIVEVVCILVFLLVCILVFLLADLHILDVPSGTGKVYEDLPFSLGGMICLKFQNKIMEEASQ